MGMMEVANLEGKFNKPAAAKKNGVQIVNEDIDVMLGKAERTVSYEPVNGYDTTKRAYDYKQGTVTTQTSSAKVNDKDHPVITTTMPLSKASAAVQAEAAEMKKKMDELKEQHARVIEEKIDATAGTVKSSFVIDPF